MISDVTEKSIVSVGKPNTIFVLPKSVRKRSTSFSKVLKRTGGARNRVDTRNICRGRRGMNEISAKSVSLAEGKLDV